MYKMMRYFVLIALVGTNVLLSAAVAERSFFVMNKTAETIDQTVSIDADNLAIKLGPSDYAYCYKKYKEDLAAPLWATIPADSSLSARETEIFAVVFVYDATRRVCVCLYKWQSYKECLRAFLRKQNAALTDDSMAIAECCFSGLNLDWFFVGRCGVSEVHAAEGIKVLWSLIKNDFQPIEATPFFAIHHIATSGVELEPVPQVASRRLAATV